MSLSERIEIVAQKFLIIIKLNQIIILIMADVDTCTLQNFVDRIEDQLESFFKQQ